MLYDAGGELPVIWIHFLEKRFQFAVDEACDVVLDEETHRVASHSTRQQAIQAH